MGLKPHAPSQIPSPFTHNIYSHVSRAQRLHRARHKQYPRYLYGLDEMFHGSAEGDALCAQAHDAAQDEQIVGLAAHLLKHGVRGIGG